MKKRILIGCSTSFYNRIEEIKDMLLEYGYDVVMPNCYDDPVTNDDNDNMSDEENKIFFRKMYNESKEKIKSVDEFLVLNFDKNKNGIKYENYIGASSFLEMYEAYMSNKKVYIFNDMPSKDNMLYDDIRGMAPILLHGKIENIKNK